MAGEKQSYPLEKIEEFTLATVPTASDWKNYLIVVSNGNAGARCCAISDGTNWKVIAQGATIS